MNMNMNLQQQIILMNQLHSQACRLLAACFYEPDRQMFLDEKLCPKLETVMAHLSAPDGKLYAKMEQSLIRHDQTELLQDYAALFLGPFGTLASPYGSVYLEPGERRLMGDTTLAVGKLYAEAGLAQLETGPPDHIALELEFLSWLGEKLSQAHSQDDQKACQDLRTIRYNFASQYFFNWIKPFCNAIREHTQTGFYRAVADSLESYVFDTHLNPTQLFSVTYTA